MFEGYRLSPQQRQLRLLKHAGQFARLAIAIEGPLDKALLRQALCEVRSRYEILRTEFQFMHGMKLPVQVVSEDASLDIQEYDFQKEAAQIDLTGSLNEAISVYEQGQDRLVLHAFLFIISRGKHLLSLPSTFAALARTASLPTGCACKHWPMGADS